jgi:hypothetical protein
MLGGLAQQVAHVEVIEIDASDAPFFAHRGCIEADGRGDDNLDLLVGSVMGGFTAMWFMAGVSNHGLHGYRRLRSGSLSVLVVKSVVQ